jgi:adenosylhomocysteinase
MDSKAGKFKVANLKLAAEGDRLVEWAESRMPVLMALRKKYAVTKPFKGYKIAGCLHVTKETAVLVRTFVDAGAEVSWSGCNPLSTNDAVAASLAKQGTSIFAWHGMNVKEFYWCIEETLKFHPNLTLDDGADLIFTIHNKHPEFAEKFVIGGTEETTTGVHRLRSMAAAGALRYPVIAVNDAETKWDFDSVLRATSVLLAGKNVVVAGFGHCGKGVALRAKGLGSNVIVTEVKATAALKATLEGYRVMTMDQAAKVGDVFITATGVKDVIVDRHFKVMKDGAVVCNTGHYDCEINLVHLAKQMKKKRLIRDNNEEYTMKDGRRLYILAQGRLVNLAAAEGHPSEVMDMSFANQFMSQLRIAELHKKGVRLENTVHDIPASQDQDIARVKLSTQGIKIDSLTPEQVSYMDDYSAGT